MEKTEMTKGTSFTTNNQYRKGEITMKLIWIAISFLVSLFLVVNGIATAGQLPQEAEYKPGELIIKFRERTTAAAKENLHRRHGSEQIREFTAYRLQHVRIGTGKNVREAISEFKSDPDVEYAEPNYAFHADVVPYDAYWGNLWGMVRINAPAAWDSSTGSSDVVIGIIDSGVDYNHPDLIANIWTEANGSHGYNAITHVNDPMDDYGHGTHVAGILGAAGNNGVGVVGLNWNVKIMACKFIDAAGAGYAADAIECLDYFRGKKSAGINIVATNNSWSGGSYSQALHDAINAQRDILFFASAGNKGTDNDITANYPASYELPNVIAVASADSNDALATSSQYGRRTVDVAAPGVGIYSTYLNSGYLSKSGTSMATPHVTGLAGLIKANNTNADWRTIKNLILSTGDNAPSITGKTLTGKRINALSALTCTDNRVLSAIQYPKTTPVGSASILSALSIICGNPTADAVIVTLSGGEVIMLHDDGMSPDIAAGDGIFTANFTSVRSSESFLFSSSAGIESIVNPPAPLTVITTSLTDGTENIAYSKALSADGGVAPYSWSVTSGSLPEGLTFSSEGVISGIPAASGIYSFSVTVADSRGATAVKALDLSIYAPVIPLSVATTYLTDATRNIAYAQTLAAIGGTTPYTWSLSSGKLPAGLTLKSSTGVISGKPNKTGSTNFTIRVISANGMSATKGLSITVR